MFHKFAVAVTERGFFATLTRVLDQLLRVLAIRLIGLFTKVDKKKIIFLNFTGNYDCNPKAICQEIIDEGVDARLIWSVYKNTLVIPGRFPRQVEAVRRNTYDFYKHMASARVIVDNGIGTAFVNYKKKRGQYLIETWHGSLGIKKFGAKDNNDRDWVRRAYREGRMTSYIISNSDFEDDIYREDFWKKTPIWKFGHPRNDILFTQDEEKIRALDRQIRDENEIPDGVRLCLYAPTFRGDGDLSPYVLDYDRLNKALEKRFGGKWVILTRFHNRTKKFLRGFKVPPTVINVSTYPDIQELMLVIDAGITDYSSWICEYLLRRKPGFIFATDLKDYAAHERSFAFPLEELPFPIATDEKELEDNILSFDNEAFCDKCEVFLKSKGSVDDGHASERVVAEIKKLLQ